LLHPTSTSSSPIEKMACPAFEEEVTQGVVVKDVSECTLQRLKIQPATKIEKTSVLLAGV
jgi:hypothetical protein